MLFYWLFQTTVDNLNKEVQKRRVDRPFQSTNTQPDFVPFESQPSSPRDWKAYIPLSLKALVWILLWKFFISIGFGAVYFIVTGSVFMYFNTGTRARGTLSAYSVFNPNQERLDGTFTAEQFEGQLRGGMGFLR